MPKPGTRAHGELVLVENRLNDCERGAAEAEALAKQTSSPELAELFLREAKLLRGEAIQLRRKFEELKAAP